MRNRATLHDVAVIGGQSHDVWPVFGHVKKLAAILDHVGYLKMVARCRTTVIRHKSFLYRDMGKTNFGLNVVVANLKFKMAAYTKIPNAIF